MTTIEERREEAWIKKKFDELCRSNDPQLRGLTLSIYDPSGHYLASAIEWYKKFGDKADKTMYGLAFKHKILTYEPLTAKDMHHFLHLMIQIFRESKI